MKPNRQSKAALIIPLLALALAGAGLVLTNTSRYGPAVSPDSVCYVSAAESLAAGNGLVLYDSTPLLLWPPLLPALLALVKLVSGADLFMSFKFINAAVFFLIIFFSGWWMNKRTGSLIMSLSLAWLVLVAAPFLLILKHAGSDLMFALLVLVALYELESFYREGGESALMKAALISALAALTRYAGVTLIAAGALIILLRAKTSLKDRLAATLWFSAISALPFSLWLLRNFLVSGTLAGPRFDSSFTLADNLMLTAHHLSLWLLPERFPFMLRLAALLAAVIVIALILNSARLKKQRSENSGPRPAPLITFIVIYLAFLIWSETRVAMDPINDRFLSLIYIPALILGFESARWALTMIPGDSRRRRAQAALLVLLLVWSVYPAKRSIESTIGAQARGAGIFAVKKWQSSELLSHLRNHPPADRLYSNNPFVVYYLAGLSSRLSLYQHPYNMPVPEKENRCGFMADSEGALLVWFDESWSCFIKLPVLEAMVELEPIATFSDGRLFRIGSAKQHCPGD